VFRTGNLMMHKRSAQTVCSKRPRSASRREATSKNPTLNTEGRATHNYEGGDQRERIADNYFSLAYSDLAAARMGMPGSASFHSVRKS